MLPISHLLFTFISSLFMSSINWNNCSLFFVALYLPLKYFLVFHKFFSVSNSSTRRLILFFLSLLIISHHNCLSRIPPWYPLTFSVREVLSLSFFFRWVLLLLPPFTPHKSLGRRITLFGIHQFFLHTANMIPFYIYQLFRYPIRQVCLLNYHTLASSTFILLLLLT